MSLSYPARFEAMAAKLAKHPRLRLLTFCTFPPATAAQLKHIEQQLGFALPKDIRRFYSETNGLQLRWINDSNPSFAATAGSKANEALAWDYALSPLRPEDGCVFFLPIQLIFQSERLFVAPSALADESIDIAGKPYQLADFYSRIRLFDAFSSLCAMCFFIDDSGSLPLLMGDEGGRCFTDSRWTNFSDYINFVLSQLGQATARPRQYRRDNGYQLPPIDTEELLPALNLEQWLFEQRFPLSNTAGSPSNIKTQAMQQAAQAKPLAEEEWKNIYQAHSEFLRMGGAGGKWTVIALRGVSVGMYGGAEAKGGKQAILDMRAVPEDWDLQEIELPFSSWCGAYIRHQDFSAANLAGSLWVDALLEKTIFADAYLQGSDFSRANLRGVSFMNADLTGADFENADLTGADFRGARLEGTKFAGAVLKGISY